MPTTCETRLTNFGKKLERSVEGKAKIYRNAVGWEEQQALAPLAPPTICCKAGEMACLKQWWVANSLKLVFTHPTILRRARAAR